MLTISQALKIAQKFISRLDSELLLAFVLKQDKIYLVTNNNKKLNIFLFLKYIFFVFKRKLNYPISYITKHKEFFGYNFSVNKHTLIPRPETELIIEDILKYNNNLEILNILDIGTGSGAIAISLKKEFNKKNKKTNILASDVSKKVLKKAKHNAKNLDADISFYKSDLLSNPPAFLSGGQSKNLLNKIINLNSKLIITANLPYLTDLEASSEPSINKEPKLALVAKQNGLYLYIKLLKQIKFNKINNLDLYLEINDHQRLELVNIINNILGDKVEIKIIKDLAGLDRIVKIEI